MTISIPSRMRVSSRVCRAWCVAETIHVIVACTARKRGKIAHLRKLRHTDEAPPWRRAWAWWSRLRAEDAHDRSARIPAQRLYIGEHWSVALQLPVALAVTGRVIPWVASAGYGLVGWDAPLRAYSATFSSGLPDSVVRLVPRGQRRSFLLAQWWNILSTFSGPIEGEPRRIATLAAADPEASLIVVASPSYIHAMEPDLLEASTWLRHPERLVVFSNGNALRGGVFSDHLVPVDDRARSVVGGSPRALNVRIAVALLRGLRSSSLDAPSLRRRYAAMTRGAQQHVPLALEAAPPR